MSHPLLVLQHEETQITHLIILEDIVDHFLQATLFTITLTCELYRRKRRHHLDLSSWHLRLDAWAIVYIS